MQSQLLIIQRPRYNLVRTAACRTACGQRGADDNGHLPEFGFNELENGIMVQQKSITLDAAGHARHDEYTRQIRLRIEEIIDQHKNDMDMGFEKMLDFVQARKKQISDEVVKGNKNINDLIF